MDAAAPQWLIDLEGSGIGAEIRRSVWIYPAANVGHVAAVAAFAGALTVMDLVLLGVIKARDRARLVLRSRRWAIALLLLVAAFVGEDWKKIYNYALQNGFRFLSYGDSSLLWRKEISALRTTEAQ